MQLRKAMDYWSRHKELYQWNPGNGRWYHIHRRNLVLSKIPKDVQRHLFNTMYDGRIIDIDAQYSKPRLNIRAVSMVYQYENRKSRDLSPANSLFLAL